MRPMVEQNWDYVAAWFGLVVPIGTLLVSWMLVKWATR